MPGTAAAPEAQRARWAVSALFFLNGASFCAILPRYPELVESIGLSNTSFGLAVGLGPLGGLLAGLGAAALMRRHGSATVSVVAQLIASTTHLLVYTSASWLWLAAALMVATAADSITDISMNANGMRVERRYRRSIMNSYHGWWSLGAVAGGLLGATGAQLGLPLWAQGTIGLIGFGAAALWARRGMLPGDDTTERAATTPPSTLPPAATALTASPSAASGAEIPADPRPAAEDAAGAAGDHERSGADDRGRAAAGGGRRWAGMSARSLGLILALGMVLVFAGATEDAGNTWGALFMTETFAATPFLAGLAFVALQGTQTVGRFLGDRIVDRLGDRRTARLGALITATGMSLALLFPTPVTALLGFAAAGWGVATLFPAAFRTADELPGLPSGVGITIVGWLARLGFFITPPLVGALADAFTLQRALWVVPVYAVGILLFSGALDAGRRGGVRTG